MKKNVSVQTPVGPADNMQKQLPADQQNTGTSASFSGNMDIDQTRAGHNRDLPAVSDAIGYFIFLHHTLYYLQTDASSALVYASLIFLYAVW